MAEIHSVRDLWRMEKEAFAKIPGMSDLLSSDRQTAEKALAKYPDAAFALMVSNKLLCGDREQSEMNQRAYLAILRGEDIANVRFRFDREMQGYVSRHMWDDKKEPGQSMKAVQVLFTYGLFTQGASVRSLQLWLACTQ